MLRAMGGRKPRDYVRRYTAWTAVTPLVCPYWVPSSSLSVSRETVLVGNIEIFGGFLRVLSHSPILSHQHSAIFIHQNSSHFIFLLINFMLSCTSLMARKTTWSITVAWSVESLPSNPATRVRFPAGSGILILLSWDWVCVLCLCSALCCLKRRLWHSSDHKLEEARPCVPV